MTDNGFVKMCCFNTFFSMAFFNEKLDVFDGAVVVVSFFIDLVFLVYVPDNDSEIKACDGNATGEYARYDVFITTIHFMDT